MKTILLKMNKKILIKAIFSVILVFCIATYVFKRERSPYTRTIDRHAASEKNAYKSSLDKWNSTLTEERSDVVILIPQDDVLKRMSEEDLIMLYWRYVNTLQILCRTQTRIGILGDGGKEICLDKPYIPKQPCIAYSIGSNFMFDFDLAMYFHFGCDVFTYDPSMTGSFLPFIKKKLLGWSIPKEINFHYVGLAGKDYINNKRWKMRTLQTIIKDNGHLDMTIDVLKIDIEGAEWDALPPFLESGLHKNVKQILLEIHVGRKRFWEDLWGETSIYKQLAVLRLLHESGFRIFQRERNLTTKLHFKVPPSDEITTVNEISLINVKYYSNHN